MSTSQTTKLKRAVDTFLLDREAQQLTPATLLWYRRYLGALATWFAEQGVTTPEGITLELLRAYVVDMQGRGYAPKTVHHYASSAKTFCAWLAEEKLVPTDPAARLKRPKIPEKVLPALSPIDVRNLLAACEYERDRALLLFMLDTGARCAETVAVNVGDVDTRTGAVTIAKGKGQKGRVVYLGVQARKALSRYLLTRDDLDPARPLWTTLKAGTRLTGWGVIELLQRISDASGIHVHPHMLRRTFAITALRAGMDLARLAALLGHSDLQTVRQYLDMVDADLADAHREHGPVDTLLLSKDKKGR